MEFGFEPVCDSFEPFRHVQIARTCSKLVADRFEAKFHYAILVADSFEAGRRPVRTSFEPVCDQLRTCLQPDSVMEFGFYKVQGLGNGMIACVHL